MRHAVCPGILYELLRGGKGGGGELLTLLYTLYALNCTAEYGTIRMQFVPLPAMSPLQPSSLHIFASAFGTDILYSLRPTLCTWNRIFRRSSGDTTVRETAPATPPATKDARTGCAKVCRMRSRAVRSGARGCRDSQFPCCDRVMGRYVRSALVLSASSWLRHFATATLLYVTSSRPSVGAEGMPGAERRRTRLLER